MELTKKRISEALKVGEYVYVLARGKLVRTLVTAIEDIGIDTELDFLPYEDHRKT